MTDEQLVLRAQTGDRLAADAIIARFAGFARVLARPYFMHGADEEDIVQEARIGLYKAVRDWRPEAGTTFKSFAALCIRRQVITAAKMANAGKHQPLTQAVREMENDDGDLVEAVSLLESPDPSPPRAVELRSEIAETATQIRTVLSRFEAHCLILFANGLDYVVIAALLGSNAKSVDNALQRARHKLEGHDAALLKTYACPGCGGATVEKPGRGRPPLCHVCTLRRLAA